AACQMPEVQGSPATAMAWIETYALRAAAQGAGLVCFPECFLHGYLVEPWQARDHAMALDSSAFQGVLERLAVIEPMLVFGMIEADGDRLYNTAVVVNRERLVGRYRKINLLPGERSVFSPGDSCPIFAANGLIFGINICSDTQTADGAAAIAAGGAKLIACPANNMMKRDKAAKWKDLHHESRA